MAGVNDVVGVGVDGVAAGTRASASAVYTIARHGRRSHQTTVTWIEGWRLLQHTAVRGGIFSVRPDLYTVNILRAKKIEIEIQTSIFATKIDKNQSFIL